MEFFSVTKGIDLDKLTVCHYLNYRDIKFSKVANMNCSLDIYIAPEDYLLNKQDIDSFAQVEYRRILQNFYICFDEQLSIDSEKFKDLCISIRRRNGRC